MRILVVNPFGDTESHGWEQLSPPEREGLLDRLDGPPEPITKDERAEWISNWSGACLSSDAYIPFRDNVDRASRSNVQYVAQPGGSQRDGEVTQAAEQYGMTMLPHWPTMLSPLKCTRKQTLGTVKRHT